MAAQGASRTGDDTAGGVILPLQSFVRLNGNPWSQIGSPVTPHPPCPDPAIHCSAHMITGSSHVRINGIPVCREGDLADCGHASTGQGWIRCD